MKDALAKKCREIRQELRNGIEVKAGRINNLEQEMLSSIEEFLIIPSDDNAAVLRAGIRTLARQARILRARVESYEAQQPQQVEEMSERLAILEKQVSGSPDYEQAMIQIEREMHEAKGSFKDILKSLLMWKEAPEEKLGNAPKF